MTEYRSGPIDRPDAPMSVLERDQRRRSAAARRRRDRIARLHDQRGRT